MSLGDYAGLSIWANVITRVLINKRAGECGSESERLEDAMSLALKMKEGAKSQGTQVASKSWKRQGNTFFPRASRRNAILLTP